MNTITIHNKQLRDLLNEKDALVKKGRKESIDIEILEKRILEHDEKEKLITNAANPKELLEKGDALQKEINGKIKELEKLGAEIMKFKLDAIPKDIKDKHYALRKQKEEKERERNKLALKVQKIKDRAIPIIQREVKPHLEKYDDIETATVRGEKIIVNVFNHLEEWKASFEKKRAPAPVQASMKKNPIKKK